MTEFDKTITLPFGTKNPDINGLVAEYAQYGMKIVPVGNIGTPHGLRAKLELAEDDFGVCAFMGSSPGVFPEHKVLARLLPEVLGQLDDRYNLKMPRISGGGNWRGPAPDELSGLMAEWMYGASRGNRFLRAVITQGLMTGKEGLPKCGGITICIKQNAAGSEDARLGLRTDALIYAGKVFPILPGGFGTLVETLISFTNLGITDGFDSNKFVLIDPVVTNPVTSQSYNYWETDIQSAIQKNQMGQVRDAVAKKINENFIVYRPDPKLEPHQMVREIVAILLAIREAAPSFAPHIGYKPVSPTVLKNYLQPFAEYSSIGRVFTNHPLDDRSWGDSLQYLSTAHRRSETLRSNAPALIAKAG